MTQTQMCQNITTQRVTRNLIIGIIAGYAVLLGLLLSLHDAPLQVLDHMTPFLVTGGLGLVLALSPIMLPGLQSRWSISGWGMGKACAKQTFAPQHAIGLMLMGVLFGALCSQLVKLLVG